MCISLHKEPGPDGNVGWHLTFFNPFVGGPPIVVNVGVEGQVDLGNGVTVDVTANGQVTVQPVVIENTLEWGPINIPLPTVVIQGTPP